jgi:hypothetical protein
VFDAIQTQFTWVIKQTLPLLARAFSLRFAGNSAGRFGRHVLDVLRFATTGETLASKKSAKVSAREKARPARAGSATITRTFGSQKASYEKTK